MSKKNVLSKFTILCWTTLRAILGCVKPVGWRLDTPRTQVPADLCFFPIGRSLQELNHMQVNTWTPALNTSFLAFASTAPDTMSPVQSKIQGSLMRQRMGVLLSVLSCSRDGLWISSQCHVLAFHAIEPIMQTVSLLFIIPQLLFG